MQKFVKLFLILFLLSNIFLSCEDFVSNYQNETKKYDFYIEKEPAMKVDDLKEDWHEIAKDSILNRFFFETGCLDYDILIQVRNKVTDKVRRVILRKYPTQQFYFNGCNSIRLLLWTWSTNKFDEFEKDLQKVNLLSIGPIYRDPEHIKGWWIEEFQCIDDLYIDCIALRCDSWIYTGKWRIAYGSMLNLN